MDRMLAANSGETREKTDREKYPKQITGAEARNVRGIKTTLTVDQLLDVPTEKDSPMIMFAGWSVFRIVVMSNNNSEKLMKNPMANITIEEVPYIYEKTKWCNQKLWELEWSGSKNKRLENTDTPNTPAYTVKLAGRFSGKTAAQYLAEKGSEGEKDLLKQKEFLSNNLHGRYAESNKAQIEGINDAINLMKQGKLNAVKSEDIVPQILVNEPIRKYFREKKEIDGKTYNKIYELRITFDAGRQYPYTVSIKNSYCSVIERPGELSTIGSENLEPSYGEIKLSAGKWLHYIETMRNRMLEHEITHYPEQERIMRKYSWKPEAGR